MLWTAFCNFTSVKAYNAWRILNPINIVSKAQAEEYGNSVARWLYPPASEDTGSEAPYRDYSKYELIARDQGDQWLVSFRLKNQGGWVLGGGGPSVHIDKSTGKIVDYGLQK